MLHRREISANLRGSIYACMVFFSPLLLPGGGEAVRFPMQALCEYVRPQLLCWRKRWVGSQMANTKLWMSKEYIWLFDTSLTYIKWWAQDYDDLQTEPNIFLRICTHTQTIPINSDLCPPKPTHSMTCVHPCLPMPTHIIQIAPMYSKIVWCVLPAYTRFWLDRTK